MFSMRILALAAVLATVAAIPTEKAVPKPVTTITDADIEDNPWFSFPLFGNLFAPLWRLFPSFAEIGPRIIADENKFQAIVNVKDYKKEDLKVKVKGDFIFVQGSHEPKQENKDIFASQFFHTYTLPENSSASAITAELSSDGYLIVNVPIDAAAAADKPKDVDQEITIVETGVPFQKEEATTIASQPSTTPIFEDERKEPTTPGISDVSDRKDNENEIPL